VHDDREVHEIMGKSMVGLLTGKDTSIHGKDDYVAYELAGSVAVFRGGYKLTKNNPPFGDRRWRLFNIELDPIEANDLSEQEPDLVKEMQADFDRYAEMVNLIPVPDDYHPLEQLQRNISRNQVREAAGRVPLLD